MHIFIWIIFLAIFLGCAYWHNRENRQLSRQWNKDLDEKSARWMTHFAWSRSFQLLGALAACTIIIIVYDMQLSSARIRLELLETSVNVSSAVPATASSSVTPLGKLPKSGEYYPPVPQLASTEETPEAFEQPAPKLEDIVNTESADSIRDLYSPEEKTNDKPAVLDKIKTHFEGILVTYFFLKKCGRIDPNDYHIITSALSREMASVNAPGRLQYDILTAAQGSYKEMYEQSSCDDASIEGLKQQYGEYISALSKQHP